jgi:hypothetical protein
MQNTTPLNILLIITHFQPFLGGGVLNNVYIVDDVLTQCKIVTQCITFRYFARYKKSEL